MSGDHRRFVWEVDPHEGPCVRDRKTNETIKSSLVPARIRTLTDKLEDTLAELRNAKSAGEITKDHMQQKIDKLTGEVATHKYNAEEMHKCAQRLGSAYINKRKEAGALTRRVEEWEAALRSVSEYRDEYEQDGEAVNEMRKIARRALAQRSEPLPDFHGDTKAVTQYEPLDLCPLCDEETDNPGKVCSACVCKDLGGTPGYDNQRSEPPAFGMEAEAIASAQLAMKNDQHSEPASNPPSDDEVHAAIERFKDELRANPHVRLIENDSKPAGAQRSEPTHKPGCPRLQYWDAGEYEASCNCDDERSEPADAEG